MTDVTCSNTRSSSTRSHFGGLYFHMILPFSSLSFPSSFFFLPAQMDYTEDGRDSSSEEEAEAPPASRSKQVPGCCGTALIGWNRIGRNPIKVESDWAKSDWAKSDWVLLLLQQLGHRLPLAGGRKEGGGVLAAKNELLSERTPLPRLLFPSLLLFSTYYLP